MAAKLQGDQAGEQGCRVQLTDDGLHIGDRADDRMNRDDITKPGGCQRDKAWAAADIGESIRNKIPDQPVDGSTSILSVTEPLHDTTKAIAAIHGFAQPRRQSTCQ